MAHAPLGEDYISWLARMAHRDCFEDGGRVKDRHLDPANEGELSSVILAVAESIEAFQVKIAGDECRIFGSRQIIDINLLLGRWLTLR